MSIALGLATGCASVIDVHHENYFRMLIFEYNFRGEDLLTQISIDMAEVIVCDFSPKHYIEG